MHCCQRCELVQPLWKIVWRFLKNISNRTATWSSNFTSGCPPMYTGNKSRILKRGPHTHVHAAPSTVAKTWKRPRHPSAGGWTKKKWCLPAAEHYSAFTKKGVLPFVTTGLGLEDTALSESSQAQKDESHTMPPVSEF